MKRSGPCHPGPREERGTSLLRGGELTDSSNSIARDSIQELRYAELEKGNTNNAVDRQSLTVDLTTDIKGRKESRTSNCLSRPVLDGELTAGLGGYPQSGRQSDRDLLNPSRWIILATSTADSIQYHQVSASNVVFRMSRESKRTPFKCSRLLVLAMTNRRLIIIIHLIITSYHPFHHISLPPPFISTQKSLPTQKTTPYIHPSIPDCLLSLEAEKEREL